MVNNRALRKEVFALYAGVSKDTALNGYWDRIQEETWRAAKNVLKGMELRMIRDGPTSSLKWKAQYYNMSIEEVVEVEKQALLKLRKYKLKELKKLEQWENELHNGSQNQYRAPFIENQALQYIQDRIKESGVEQNEGESQLIQIIQGTIAVNEHYKKTPLERMGLDRHMYCTLRDLGVKTAMDIAQYSREEILQQKQIGKGKVTKLQAKLKGFGLSLK